MKKHSLILSGFFALSSACAGNTTLKNAPTQPQTHTVKNIEATAKDTRKKLDELFKLSDENDITIDDNTKGYQNIRISKACMVRNKGCVDTDINKFEKLTSGPEFDQCKSEEYEEKQMECKENIMRTTCDVDTLTDYYEHYTQCQADFITCTKDEHRSIQRQKLEAENDSVDENMTLEELEQYKLSLYKIRKSLEKKFEDAYKKFEDTPAGHPWGWYVTSLCWRDNPVLMGLHENWYEAADRVAKKVREKKLEDCWTIRTYKKGELIFPYNEEEKVKCRKNRANATGELYKEEVIADIKLEKARIRCLKSRSEIQE